MSITEENRPLVPREKSVDEIEYEKADDYFWCIKHKDQLVSADFDRVNTFLSSLLSNPYFTGSYDRKRKVSILLFNTLVKYTCTKIVIDDMAKPIIKLLLDNDFPTYEYFNSSNSIAWYIRSGRFRKLAEIVGLSEEQTAKIEAKRKAAIKELPYSTQLGQLILLAL